MAASAEAKHQTGKPRILVVGGVAGGASCAARARRLSEDAEIVVFERGPYVSFANCGLPYYVGDVITDERSLLVATPELFKRRFNIEVRLQSEVRAVDRAKQEIEVRNILTGEVSRERYDALVLAPGSAPIRPPLPGIDLPGIFTLRTIPDSRQMKQWITERKVERAVVVGGGFIGLETTENLVRRGISVTIVEMLPQVMPPIDPEMAVAIQDHLAANGVSLHLADGVAGFVQSPDGHTIAVNTRSGASFSCDMVLLAIGVRPEAALAREAGLETGQLGGIRVNDQMRTSDEHVWAVGDAVEVRDFVTGDWSLIPLAGPANRQGRIAADAILGRDARFRGVQGTAVCRVFDITVAATGASEKTLRRRGAGGQPLPYEKVYLHPGHHANYYPGARPITIKLIFSPKRRPRSRRPGGRRGRRGEADRCHRHGHPAGVHRFRPGAGRALLCSAVRHRQGPGQCGRHDRGQRRARRCAGGPLERRLRFGRVPSRRPRARRVQAGPSGGSREHPPQLTSAPNE